MKLITCIIMIRYSLTDLKSLEHVLDIIERALRSTLVTSRFRVRLRNLMNSSVTFT